MGFGLPLVYSSRYIFYIFPYMYSKKREEEAPARWICGWYRTMYSNNVVMSAGKRSCPDIICYLLSVICNAMEGEARARW